MIRNINLISIASTFSGHAISLPLIWFYAISEIWAEPNGFHFRGSKYRGVTASRNVRLGSLRPSSVRASAFVAAAMYFAGLAAFVFAVFLPNERVIDLEDTPFEYLDKKIAVSGAIWCTVLVMIAPGIIGSLTDVLVFSYFSFSQSKNKTRPSGSDEAISTYSALSKLFTVGHWVFFYLLYRGQDGQPLAQTLGSLAATQIMQVEIASILLSVVGLIFVWSHDLVNSILLVLIGTVGSIFVGPGTMLLQLWRYFELEVADEFLSHHRRSSKL
ncbi:hypothetical protein HDU97_006856 [Phlyctochytrium planicorne]|nr:hypothetical protein HDU97_006856 [Phlyctochytrium planicorne]